ncbi:hypothetical protein ARC20_04360 [Stenotrophomonas panacihumi]|uniref:Uncharacterized protein n=1 Tax=Stenotrophomonas panacihumi TaxID=676599 RepID=A0A0R0ANU4_9GAMM|nr:hypothetical protein [Stenotrophomonas panacihumi]KRG46907.1 hypothetical protein ARC20_04360 [Stenotrophomonas panacihumi]PTN54434.1 hypothetical protein C9J98_11430 [Stenotrophomonas panacihumi]
MNTKSLSVALALAAGSVFGSMSAQAATINTLDAVQVRPSAEQIAQREHELNSDIPTLAAVQVRPTVGQILELQAEQAAAQRVVTLASVEVRPSAEQRAELDNAATPVASADATSASIAALLGQVIVNLPVPHLQPSPSQLEALLGEMVRVQAQF